MSWSTKNVRLAEIRASHDPLAKTLVFLLVFLALLLLLTGVMSAWFFKRIDTDYSKLMAETTADLRNVHDIAFHSSLTYTHLMELPLARDRQRRGELLRIISERRMENDKLFDQLDRSIVSRGIRSRLEEMKSKRLIYLSEFNALVTATEEGGQIEIQSPEWFRLTAAFINYQSSCKKLADRIERKSLQRSGDTTAGVAKLRLLFFGLGVLPIGLALLLILVVLYLIWATPTEVELRDAASPHVRGGDPVKYFDVSNVR